MGIDYDGGMVVGAQGCDIPDVQAANEHGSFEDFCDNYGIDQMPLHYDADRDCTVYGFFVDDILVSEINDVWIEDIKQKAKKFKELTGAEAKLIGTQSIW